VKTATRTTSPGVRRLNLESAGLTLSCLVSEPEHQRPRAVVFALHGGGTSAAYFDGQAHPDLSLLTLGASLGFTVLALDRPGYGDSAATLPEGLTLDEQADVLAAAVAAFAESHPTGAGTFLLAHSYGGKLALRTAAHGSDLLGLDISGCGYHYILEPEVLSRQPRHTHVERIWGPLHLYPPGTFRSGATPAAPQPLREAAEAAQWPEVFEELAPQVRLSLRLTFAEHEAWWRHSPEELADITARLSSVPRLRIDRQPDSGHNISLGLAARSYHLRALAFFEECLAAPAHTS